MRFPDLFFWKNKVFFPEKVHENIAEENVGFIRVPGSWVMRFRELTELSQISLCKRKAVE